MCIRDSDNPTFQMADVDLKFSSPEMRVNINRDKAGTMGATVREMCIRDSYAALYIMILSKRL